jgi:superfamily I DNA/RNA helicase
VAYTVPETLASLETVPQLLSEAFEQRIPASFLPTRRKDGTVGVSTIHSSKGLDAEHVLILGVHELDGLPTQEEAHRLLYIAMTRARDELCISSARPSRVMDELARAVTSAAA